MGERDDMRRESDKLLGRIEEYMRNDASWKETFERNYMEDRRANSATHKDLYEKVAAADRMSGKQGAWIAGLSAGVVAAWEGAKHYFGSK